ncbi:hypothetical protein BKA64DRAFT_701488 [Cadophora sp. MPI-SDFR-AT-0126]|nr:hypothetical protein BKA64DRAFT_701488 [Leotiomycetes sp. MPI-SDFR-AT-0126]
MKPTTNLEESSPSGSSVQQSNSFGEGWDSAEAQEDIDAAVAELDKENELKGMTTADDTEAVDTEMETEQTDNSMAHGTAQTDPFNTSSGCLNPTNNTSSLINDEQARVMQSNDNMASVDFSQGPQFPPSQISAAQVQTPQLPPPRAPAFRSATIATQTFSTNIAPTPSEHRQATSISGFQSRRFDREAENPDLETVPPRCNLPAHNELIGEIADLKQKLRVALDRQNKLEREQERQRQRAEGLQTQFNNKKIEHTKELDKIIALVNGKEAVIKDNRARVTAPEAAKRAWESEKRAWESGNKTVDSCYGLGMDVCEEADLLRSQNTRAKDDTCGIVGDCSVHNWVPQAADAISYQQNQIIELKRKLTRIHRQNYDARKLEKYEKEYPKMHKDLIRATREAERQGPELKNTQKRLEISTKYADELFKDLGDVETRLTNTIKEQILMLQNLRSRSLATTHLPLTEDEQTHIASAYQESKKTEAKSESTESTKDLQSEAPNTGSRKPEPVPDPSNPGTFGLFFNDDSDSDSESEIEAEDMTADITQRPTKSTPTAVPSSSTSARASANKGFLYYLTACWKSRKLILAGFIVLLLILLDIYRVLGPMPVVTAETPTPDYEIVSHKDEAPTAWHVVRETGYDFRPESNPDPPIANGLLTGTLAVLSAGVFAADSYTWWTGWRGANPR